VFIEPSAHRNVATSGVSMPRCPDASMFRFVGLILL
jgi:hypothetical protein